MSRPNSTRSGQLLFGVAGVMLLAGASLLAVYFTRVKDASASTSSVAAVATTAEPSGAALDAVTTAVERYLEGDIALRFGDRSVTVKRSDLGVTADETAVQKAAARVAAAGGAAELSFVDYEGGVVPVRVDREAAEAALRELKPILDKAPVNARLDLEERQVIAEQPGLGVELFGSVSALETAVRTGATEVELEGAPIPSLVTVESLGVSDIDTVISTYTTRFSVIDKTRNDNLKLLASKINGLVLQPGEVFSFNDTTGMRTLEDGFKMAHVISAGEMVDGMAGGSCQISSTLHGAAFFGGLDIVKSTPHSRPSTYITMGLDATVVAGIVDLKLKNSFEFPVVIHFKVARGESTVEILGADKPFDKIEFRREIKERVPFETITREDMEIGVGHMVVDQAGYPGYKLERVRRIFKDGKVVKKDKWRLFYRPVIEYARIGINPDPNLPAPKAKRGHGPKPAKEGVYTLVR